MRRYSRIFTLFIVFVFIFLLIMYPTISTNGIIAGLKVCVNIIIPSLFPFTVCILMLMKSGFYIKNKKINIILYRCFGHDFDMFFVFLMSLVGGYPVGARLINELCKQKVIDEKIANIMLMYCVNAGPTFVYGIIYSLYNSKQLAIMIIASHITASICIAIFLSFFLKKYDRQNSKYKNVKAISFSQNLVNSVCDASMSIMSICSYVVLFSSINAYVDYFLDDMSIMKYVSYFTEVTSSVVKSNNLHFSTFLFGFSGLSIWCQIFAMSSQFKVDIKSFFVGRFLHGAISVMIMNVLIRLFKTSISTFSNQEFVFYSFLNSNIILIFTMFLMIITFLISIKSKKYSGKFIDDVI